MRCRNCGWDNPEGSLRCAKCNQPLTPSMATPAPHPVARPAAPSPAAPGPAQPAPHRFTVLDASAGMPMPPQQQPQSQPQPQQQPQQQPLKNCPQCKYPVTSYSDNCPNCGCQLVVPAPAPAAAPAIQAAPAPQVKDFKLTPITGGPAIPLHLGQVVEIGNVIYRFEQ